MGWRRQCLFGPGDVNTWQSDVIDGVTVRQSLSLPLSIGPDISDCVHVQPPVFALTHISLCWSSSTVNRFYFCAVRSLKHQLPHGPFFDVHVHLDSGRAKSCTSLTSDGGEQQRGRSQCMFTHLVRLHLRQ